MLRHQNRFKILKNISSMNKISVNPYINFNGNCEAAFNFYQSVFGGEFTYISRFKDMPERTVAAEYAEQIMHVSLPISDEFVLMGSDTPEQPVQVGNNISLSINAHSEADADNLFNGLSAGGTVIMAMSKTFWGAYFGMFTDKFGINWMINYDYPRD
jgi:PhnB protein